MKRFSLRSNLGWVFVVIFLVLLWQFVLPPNYGGKTTFLTTSGHSMEPELHTGDLAILRKQPSYKVGDVIEYHSDSLNIPILHRIIAIDGRGITTRGDNNGFDDLDHPSKKQITGKLVYHAAGGGKYLHLIKSSVVRIGGAFLIGLFAFNVFRPRKDELEGTGWRGRFAIRRQTVEKIQDVSTGVRQTGVPVTPASARAAFERSSVTKLVKVFGAVLVVSALLSAYSFNRPLTTTVNRQTIYNINGKFNYSAYVPNSSLIYADNQLQTGDPIYLNIVKDLFITYNVKMNSGSTFKGDGEITMKALIKGGSGWSHEIPIDADVKFDGDEGRVSTVLNLPSIIDIAKQASQLTKVPASTYTISLQPTVRMDGMLGGAKLNTRFTQELKFTGNSVQLKSASGSVSSTAADPSATAKAAGSKTPVPSTAPDGSAGTLDVPSTVPNRLGAFGIGLGIAVLRALALLGMFLSVLGLVLSLLQWRSSSTSHHGDAGETPSAVDEEDLLTKARSQFEQMVMSVKRIDSLDALTTFAAANGVQVTADEFTGEYRAVVGSSIYIYRRPVYSAEARFGANHDSTMVKDSQDSKDEVN